MAAIRSKGTAPERRVRKALRKLKLRYRSNVRGLPGTPDFALPDLQVMIFVHGCFWHRHPGCRYAFKPATRRAFWEAKFQANTTRDARVAARARRSGWHVWVLWECSLAKAEASIRARLRRLRPTGS